MTGEKIGKQGGMLSIGCSDKVNGIWEYVEECLEATTSKTRSGFMATTYLIVESILLQRKDFNHQE